MIGNLMSFLEQYEAEEIRPQEPFWRWPGV